MAATFHKFPELEPELRLMVWKEALLGARDTRVVILYNDRVMPLKNLISPLLAVGHEARACAQAFYNVKLDILVVPQCGVYPDLLFEGVQKLAGAVRLERSGPEYALFIRKMLRERVAPDAIREAERDRLKVGEIYVSPEHDTLISGYDCDPDPRLDDLLDRHLIEFDLVYDDSPQPIEYTKEEADRLWQVELFPNLRCHYTLPLEIEEYDRFLLGVLRSEGRLPHNPERWVWHTGEYSQGEPVLVNELDWTWNLELEKLEAEGSDAQG
ncbi:hypothetical protein VMCG_00729 [Cytospora schulzeri]|uniref:2EXR domain-containing protein n=1 Tax=Cytospora schulzeri TaxID=448051 RepID=A0A423X7W4_9PEZI|nr:hypothetical protein VMCG_00729 [Valsa malicola]